MANLKKNIFYSGLLTFANYLFPLITYPYVSRVLGVANIGVCNFVDSILQWFIVFSMMGITILGNREIAAAGKEGRSRAFSELLALNLTTTLLAEVALVGAMYTVPSLFPYRKLLWVGVLKLMANFACIEWFFRGTERFKYITLRSVGVKFLYVIAVFVFVRRAEDYPVYYLLTTLMLAGNALINLVSVRSQVKISFRKVHPGRYLRSYLVLGLYMFLTSMYITFNVTYLGFVSDAVQVGYYTTASKLQAMIIAFFSAFTGVMLPRMSSLLSEGQEEEFRSYIDKSFDLLLLFAVPLVIYTVVGAPELIRLLAGPGYEGAVLPARIIMFLILVVGFEQIFVIQILMPLKRDRDVFVNSLVAALLGLTLNLLLVRRGLAVASAVVWLCCELTVLLLSACFVRHHIGIRFPFRQLGRSLLAYAPALAVGWAIEAMLPTWQSRFVALSLWMGLYILIYAVYVSKNETVVSALETLKWRLR